jgi:hypothetical protein
VVFGPLLLSSPPGVLIIILKLNEIKFLAIKLLDEEAESICRGVINSISLSLALYEIGIESGIKGFDAARHLFVDRKSLGVISFTN